MKWLLITGIETARMLEKIAIPIGYHIALAGSVLHSGKSNKDLDIIVYKHEQNGPDRGAEFRLECERAKFTNWEKCGNSEYIQVREIWKCLYEGNRVDFFFL